VMLAVAGVNARCVIAPGVTFKVAVPTMPLSFPVTVCAPAIVLLQELPVQVPLVTKKVVAPVTSPRLLPYWS